MPPPKCAAPKSNADAISASPLPPRIPCKADCRGCWITPRKKASSATTVNSRLMARNSTVKPGHFSAGLTRPVNQPTPITSTIVAMPGSSVLAMLSRHSRHAWQRGASSASNSSPALPLSRLANSMKGRASAVMAADGITSTLWKPGQRCKASSSASNSVNASRLRRCHACGAWVVPRAANPNRTMPATAMASSWPSCSPSARASPSSGSHGARDRPAGKGRAGNQTLQIASIKRRAEGIG